MLEVGSSRKILRVILASIALVMLLYTSTGCSGNSQNTIDTELQEQSLTEDYQKGYQDGHKDGQEGMDVIKSEEVEKVMSNVANSCRQAPMLISGSLLAIGYGAESDMGVYPYLGFTIGQEQLDQIAAIGFRSISIDQRPVISKVGLSVVYLDQSYVPIGFKYFESPLELGMNYVPNAGYPDLNPIKTSEFPADGAPIYCSLYINYQKLEFASDNTSYEWGTSLNEIPEHLQEQALFKYGVLLDTTKVEFQASDISRSTPQGSTE